MDHRFHDSKPPGYGASGRISLTVTVSCTGSARNEEQAIPMTKHTCSRIVFRPKTGVPTSLDGRTLPEMKIANQQAATMSAGVNGAGQPITVMECRFNDGTPFPQTIGGKTASDWRLMPVNPNDPTAGAFWEPIP